MGTSSPEVFLALDRSRPRALRVQIEDELRAAIRSGRLGPGGPVPSSRELAADLQVSRKVVVEAYDQLVAEGYLVARRGAQTTVRGAPPRPTAPAPSGTGPAAAPPVEIDFRPGRPDLSLFPRAVWARATRSALRALPTADLADDDPRGLPVLRRALADYLGRVRGVTADPERIVVCAGFGHGFDLVLGALTGLGHARFAVEDPGYPGPRRRLVAGRIPFDAVPVDADGLVVDRLADTAARAVVLTPAHQSPTGVVLSAGRRHQLVAWARAVDGVLIEDDFDAEYRYDRRPVGALQGLAPERVVYCGTTAKSLASGLRLGWLVLPEALVEPVLARRRITDGATSTLLQAGFAEFLAAHELDRHLRRVRRTYRQRRDALVAAVHRWLPEASVHGVAAGLNALVTFPPGVEEATLVRRAMAAGVRVHPLADFRVHPAAGDPAGLLLGYATVPPAAATEGVRRLAAAV